MSILHCRNHKFICHKLHSFNVSLILALFSGGIAFSFGTTFGIGFHVKPSEQRQVDGGLQCVVYSVILGKALLGQDEVNRVDKEQHKLADLQLG